MTDSPNFDPMLGKVLEDRYSVDELIARGGMATVYRGTDLRLGRTVALKVLGGVLVNDPDFVERFTQEARATAALTHPNVVAVHDQGISEGFPFLVMEFVQGRTIREIMAQSGPFTSAHALEIISAVLAGLSSAHDAGFVHRDIKPENVLITNDGHIKVTDFGLARVISDTPVSDSTGAVLLGTMAYLSPEQVQQLAVDQRSDVYSCGILLYEMVTGLVPFTGTSPLDVAYQHVNSSVSAPSSIQPDVPPAVDHLVLAATRKSPAERIQSAREFRDGVIRAISAVPRAEALTTALPLQNTQVIPTPVRGAHRATGAVPLQKPNPGIGPSGVHRDNSTRVASGLHYF
jgi:serine/threonine-protein kinase